MGTGPAIYGRHTRPKLLVGSGMATYDPTLRSAPKAEGDVSLAAPFYVPLLTDRSGAIPDVRLIHVPEDGQSPRPRAVCPRHPWVPSP